MASKNMIQAAVKQGAERPRWCPTPTADRILGAIAYAHAAGDLAVVYGAAGAGKTTTARHYAESRTNAWMATMAPDCSSPVGCLEELCDELGVDAGGGARRMARALRKRISGTRGVIIIDEAQHLSLQAVEELRSIHDATGIGLALIGNDAVYTRLTGGARAAHFAQLFSRIGARVAVGRPAPEDVQLIAASWGVTGAEEIRWLGLLASKPGALRSVVKTLALAGESVGDGPLGIDHIKRAWASLGAVG